MSGALFENYVISEIIKKHTHHKTYAEFYFLLTSNGEEIDLIIDYKQNKQLIEIKKTSTFQVSHTKQLKKFLLDKNDTGYVIYNGKTMQYRENIKICNFHDYILES